MRDAQVPRSECNSIADCIFSCGSCKVLRRSRVKIRTLCYGDVRKGVYVEQSRSGSQSNRVLIGGYLGVSPYQEPRLSDLGLTNPTTSKCIMEDSSWPTHLSPSHCASMLTHTLPPTTVPDGPFQNDMSYISLITLCPRSSIHTWVMTGDLGTDLLVRVFLGFLI